MFAHQGIELRHATLADWVGKASFHLRLIVDSLTDDLKASGKLGMDETPVPVLDPGAARPGRGTCGRWCATSGHGRARTRRAPSTAMRPGAAAGMARPCSKGSPARSRLTATPGTTGCVGMTGSAGRSPLRTAGPTVDAASGRSTIPAVRRSPGRAWPRIKQLNAIEGRIRGEHPSKRQFVRWTESAPLVNAFGVWFDEQRSRVSPRSRLGEKLAYFTIHWDGMLVFLHDGRVKMDTKFVENRIRPLKLTKKNALFAGHDEGAVSWARITTLIETCKMNGIEPYAWLRIRPERIAAGHLMSRIHELLPWNFKPAHEFKT